MYRATAARLKSVILKMVYSNYSCIKFESAALMLSCSYCVRGSLRGAVTFTCMTLSSTIVVQIHVGGGVVILILE